MQTINVPGNIRVIKEAPNAVLKHYGQVIARNAAIRLTKDTYQQKDELAREAAAIFAREIDSDPALTGMSMSEAIKAADYSDPEGNLGLLSGTLALQKALPLLQYEYPILGKIWSDFSPEPGLLNQTEMTRVVLKPAVQSYSTALDSSGRPSGWSTVSPAQTVDVPITIDEYVGVPIVFGNDILASTFRKLFNEITPQALYALGGHLVNKLTALFTPANYNAYSATSATGGATTTGSTTISVTSTAGMFAGQAISGTGLAPNSYVASVTSGTGATLTQPVVTGGSSLTFTLNNGQVPTTYATYAQALADFNLASLDEIAGAFDMMEVPQQDRFALLNSQYYRRLRQDPSLNMFFAAQQMPSIITEGRLPHLTGFAPYNAPYFPTANYGVGFVGHKAAAVLKTRLPVDFTKVVDAMVPGSVTTVVDPNTGISVVLVQYINLVGHYAEWRPEVMMGAAVGDPRAGLVVTSQ